MANYTDTDEFVIPLVRRIEHAPTVEALRPDRMSAASSGALAGAIAGLGALAFVHAIAADDLYASIDRVATARDVPFAAAFAGAYVTAGTLGAAAGGIFGGVTRYLRKWPALVFWSVVFFVSVALVFTGAEHAFGGGADPNLAGPVIGASALYGFLVPFSLPIRRPR